MTYNKQIRELEALIEKLGKDFKLCEFMDTWKIKYDGPMGIKRTEEVREVITLETVYNQFVNKSGIFYEFHKSTESFRDFVKVITGRYFKPEKNRKLIYEDSFNKFHEEWNRIHPEISYEKYEKQEDEKEARRLSQLMAIYQDPFQDPYFKIRNFLS